MNRRRFVDRSGHSGGLLSIWAMVGAVALTGCPTKRAPGWNCGPSGTDECDASSGDSSRDGVGAGGGTAGAGTAGGTATGGGNGGGGSGPGGAGTGGAGTAGIVTGGAGSDGGDGGGGMDARFVITKDGNGSGTVSASWQGGSLNCGSNCSAAILQGTEVTLQATPDTGSAIQWSAPCTGSDSCRLTIGAGVTQVKVTFTLTKVTVTVARSGSGSVSGAGGVSCTDPSCGVPVDYGSALTLTASPMTGYAFGSWQGCTTTNGVTCTLARITSAKTVTATFTVMNASFNILKSGTGSGTVTATWRNLSTRLRQQG